MHPVHLSPAEAVNIHICCDRTRASRSTSAPLRLAMMAKLSQYGSFATVLGIQSSKILGILEHGEGRYIDQEER
jgi:hypothetical protein